MSYETEATTSPVFLDVGLVEYPFIEYGDNTALEVTQKFAVRAANYAPIALNTAYSSSANLPSHPGGSLYFVGDTKPIDIGAGCVGFTRRWVKPPASTLYNYTTAAVTFPGIAYAGEDSRRPFQRVVTVQIAMDYYVVGGVAYPTVADIPTEDATEFKYSYETAPRDAGNIQLNAFSTPTAASWIAGIATAAFSYVIEASTIERYAGNIYVRTTKRVRPI